MLNSTTKTTATLYLVDASGKVVVKQNLEINQGINEMNLNFNVSAGVMYLKIVSSVQDFGIQKIVFK